MSQPRFLEAPKGLTTTEIAALTGAAPQGGAPPDRVATGVAPLDRAGPQDLAFLENKKYAAQLPGTRAGILFVSARYASAAPASAAVLVTPHPYRAFVTTTQALFPGAARPSSLFEASGVAPGALVHPTARLEAGVTVDPAAVIGPRAEIGSGTVVAATAVIGPGVRIGRNCSIGAGATLSHALLGDRVIIHAGCRIGQDGFGYVPSQTGPMKVPQVGRVIIQDDVEIGANTAVDRGAIKDTVIGQATKIDNLCQIAHNVTIGRFCMIASQTGISGSVTVEDFVMMGGKVGIVDHVTIGTGAMIAAGSGIMSNVPPGSKWGGSPALPARDWLKGQAVIRRLARQGGARGGADEGDEA
jgi:UDP-3-O-[3-hydroxymyristoyl] glucosamine N-acyltransferase